MVSTLETTFQRKFAWIIPIENLTFLVVIQNPANNQYFPLILLHYFREKKVRTFSLVIVNSRWQWISEKQIKSKPPFSIFIAQFSVEEWK